MENINDEPVYTERQVQQIITTARAEDRKRLEDAYRGTDLPMEILSLLEESTPNDLKDNLKQYRRSLSKYNDDFWTIPETMDKEFTTELKRAKMEVHQAILSSYKFTETTRQQARGATEVYEQLKSLANKINFSNREDQEFFEVTLENVKNLSAFGWGSAYFQDKDTKQLALKHIRLPETLKHLATPDDDQRTRKAFGPEFVGQVNKGRFEQKLTYKAASGNGFQSKGNSWRRNGRDSGRGTWHRTSWRRYTSGHQSFYGRGRGKGASHPQQEDSTNYTNSSQNTNH
jgi:hypothetical protein